MDAEQDKDRLYRELNEISNRIKESLKVVARSDPDRAAAWVEEHKARMKAILEAAKLKA